MQNLMYGNDFDSLRLRAKVLPLADASVGQVHRLHPAHYLGMSVDFRSSSGTFWFPSLLIHEQTGSG